MWVNIIHQTLSIDWLISHNGLERNERKDGIFEYSWLHEIYLKDLLSNSNARNKQRTGLRPVKLDRNNGQSAPCKTN